MTVSVIIRCRNEEAHIGRLLTGLMRQRTPADEIILVDSGSTDATLSIASAFPAHVVHIDAEDFSFGRACNIGMAAATSEFAIFVSAHCYPLHDTWIDEMIAPFRDPDVALTYGRQTGPPTVRFSEQRLFETWFPEQTVARQRHPFCNNANAAIRRAVWDNLAYDEQLTGLEDLDWARRAIDAGHVISYIATAPVVHVHEENFSQVVNRYRREAIAHKQIYEDQRMSLGEAAVLTVTHICSDWVAALRARSPVIVYLSVGKFRLAQFVGTYRGFTQQGPVSALLKRRFFYPEERSRRSQISEIDERSLIDYDAPAEPH